MKLGKKIQPLSIEYPPIEDFPKNLINTEIGGKFEASQNVKPFLEQFQSENRPHKIRHLDYQFGKINGKRATKYFLKDKPIRIIYSDRKDPIIKNMNEERPSKINFPPNSASTPIARTLREMALKWVAEKYFNSINYMAFDEPILNKVNPDLLVIPNQEVNKIIEFSHLIKEEEQEEQEEQNNSNHLHDIDLDKPCFVEIKAYHGSTEIGEKEMLQSYNYSVLGGKTLLLTTGRIGAFETIDNLNKQLENSKKNEEGYDPKIFTSFVKDVSKKYKNKIKSIDLNMGQDQYDTRGIYYSVKSKLKKMQKYTVNWPLKIEYKILQTPNEIEAFIDNGQGLGIIEPKSFYDLLNSKGMNIEANLFKNIADKYIEEIMINPTVLYPK